MSTHHLKLALLASAAGFLVGATALPSFGDEAPQPKGFLPWQDFDEWLQVAEGERRRPGYQPPVRTDPNSGIVYDPEAVPLPPRETGVGDFLPIPDRWRLIEAVGVHENLWDPYNQNTLKGDRPIIGDWFLNLSAISDTVFEPRSFPLPHAIATTQNSGSVDQFGLPESYVFNQNLILSVSWIKGNTAFKPQDWEFRFVPVLNFNYADVKEKGILIADEPNKTTRDDAHIGLQEAFVDYHIRNVSDRYDFDSLRVGVQPYSSDFRGFLFQDNQLGVRVFGNRDNNLWQYNLAAFARLEKDTNSGLNDVDADKPIRDDYVYIASLFKQDFPVLGMQSQATVVYNVNEEGDDERFFDANGFQARPDPAGTGRGSDYDVTYLGINNDGRIGRLNLSTSAYYATGKQERGKFSDVESDISAYFFAAEPSIDFDWARFRLSAAYASGDDDVYDNKEEGFDAIFENPQFAGSDTSYWIRQQIPVIRGNGRSTTGISSRNAMLPSLRTSKELGQSDFVNPGLTLLGAGADLDLLPEMRLSFNANHLWFNEIGPNAPLDVSLNQQITSHDIGWDLSAAMTWRPLFMQNIVFRLSGAVLVPGKGFEQIYTSQDSSDYYYSVLANLVLTY
jgi:hypothetical protein